MAFEVLDTGDWEDRREVRGTLPDADLTMSAFTDDTMLLVRVLGPCLPVSPDDLDALGIDVDPLDLD
ncbi:hypothetical protein [Cellulomonas bogoriensis]|uniref:Uncharacterized protein n=1 Tax=Cellulomonas bogoriensis 69B4 = DSM 16987 TaxID=1386082 RepID=A0A0A0C165_9CELL|nr:hypothetical protein [Cellulomonas bogoriensis]KGM13129.1 hypothetical protein N869_16095 [Cellulomonas bogoriensis 69B4 = DSM 16987]